jgi:phytoene dehydrogenase-like protein
MTDLAALLDELERLEKAATPGPWDHGGSDAVSHWIWERCGITGDPDAPDTRIASASPADSAFITAIRNALPRLLSELRALLAVERAAREDYLRMGAALDALEKIRSGT